MPKKKWETFLTQIFVLIKKMMHIKNYCSLTSYVILKYTHSSSRQVSSSTRCFPSEFVNFYYLFLLLCVHNLQRNDDKHNILFICSSFKSLSYSSVNKVIFLHQRNDVMQPWERKAFLSKHKKCRFTRLGGRKVERDRRQ